MNNLFEKEMMDDVFQQHDAFRAKMIDAYTNGMVNAAYKPYIEWKQGHSGLPTKEEVAAMKYMVSIELDGYYDKYPEAYKETDGSVYLGEYKGYKEDAEKVAILEAIDAELTNLQFAVWSEIATLISLLLQELMGKCIFAQK